MTISFLFLLALACGVLTTLFWIPPEELGRGYFQMSALIVLGLLTLALAVALLHPTRHFLGDRRATGLAVLVLAFLLGFAHYAAVWRERWRPARWFAATALLVSSATLLASGLILISGPTPLPHRQGLLVAALTSSSLLLGWSLVTMLLGHWYLIVPRLTFRYLITFCTILLGIVALRWISVVASVAAAWRVDQFVEPHPWRLLAEFGGQGMFFWFRALWGLAIPLVLAIMSLQCARNRSNQSATGILYVLVVGSFIGEVTALYLMLTTGVPV